MYAAQSGHLIFYLNLVENRIFAQHPKACFTGWHSDCTSPTFGIRMTSRKSGMASELEILGGNKQTIPAGDDRKLLLEAFEMFTQASDSLESAFSHLQARAQRLTEELEAKNIELGKSLLEKEEAQNYLKTILERLPCGVLVLNEKGDVTLCNDIASELLKSLKDKSRRKRGSEDYLLSTRIRNDLAESVALGAGQEELEIPFVTGGKRKVLATSGAPLTDAGGSRIGTLHIIRDITEMKALQEHSKRMERLSAMGEMAVELAHEIRNPLGSIELFASLLENELSGDERRWAENIRIGIQSLNNIVSNMLQFARPLSPSLLAVDAHDVIREVLNFTGPIMAQRQVSVLTQLAAEYPVISADRELFRQMLLNLVLNAMNAMPAKGSLTISTGNVQRERFKKGAGGLELRIQDTGIGIPPENLGKIFDPFFTTNKNGTGLGLSVVHQIVERHGGSIEVSSEINLGTTFTIAFECAPGVAKTCH
jgi:signal transduction histidine kinase